MRFLKRKNKTISNDAAREFCKCIKYFDKLEFIEGCKYTIEYLGKKAKEYDSFEEAVAVSIKHQESLTSRGGAICICIYNPQFKSFPYKKYIGKSIFEVKEECIEYAEYRYIWISPSYDRIYMECIDLGDHTLSYDYELMYGNNTPILKIDVPYISSFTGFIKRNNCKKPGINNYYHYYTIGKKATKTRNPLIISNSELDVLYNTDIEYEGLDVFYGIKGYYQQSTDKGLVYDWDEHCCYSILPIASISEYREKRPMIENITRYKVYVSIRVYDTENIVNSVVYIDYCTGDLQEVEKEILNERWNWNGEVKINKIEIVPDGKWII